MPALVHLTRLGYKYFGKISEETAGSTYDPDTNILLNVFKEQFEKLNPGQEGLTEQTLKDIRLELNNDDLGRSFYKRLTTISPTKLIDFDNPENNTFHFTAEFTCRNGEDNFRPDITLFINGLPLVFIEVKKPNNHGGMVAEANRMSLQRFPNKKFRRFINITQLMIFSNNMEYDAKGGIVPIEGAFYCTAARKSAPFNCFREENIGNAETAPFIKDFPYEPIDAVQEKRILEDFNCQVIHTHVEYQSNLKINTPTNRIITSMCSKERLLFLLKYGIAYVKMEREVDGKIESLDQKHIMRYQQMFAALAVRKKLSEGVKSGIIWHTQGSGKTALSYYLSYILNDFYAKQNKVPKFYFIVDRLDLLEQATQEFEARGLVVSTANTRKELMEQFRENQAHTKATGQAEITVVNIQRFAEEREKVRLNSYATNLQRIFILDEAHRGYKPGGCFLANLFEADPDSIKIALTGTPLLAEERASCKVFGDYLHTYYYDRSIQDGYTLKIIREDIETSYRDKITEAFEKLDVLVQKKDIKKSDIIEHETYVRELLRYMINDLQEFRDIQGDQTLGGMIICETSGQARKLYELFDEIQEELNETRKKKLNMKAGLILHDSDDKETRKQIVKDFKKNMTIDMLIVFNMLLTGFDAPRLKRLYFGRKLKDHNLLQAITRVNRPYRNMKYGFLIDFADIKQNFIQTNEAYLLELNRYNDVDVLGHSITNTFASVIEDKDEIIDKMKEIKQVLFDYSYENAEEFTYEISTLEDKSQLLNLREALSSAKDMANLVRTFGDDEMREEFAKVEITKLPLLLQEVNRRIDMINQKEAFETSEDTKIQINKAMLNVEFNFSNIGSEELKMIGSKEDLNNRFQSVVNAFINNFDTDDPEYITIQEAFRQRFKEHGFTVDSMAKFNEQTKALDEILQKLRSLEERNRRLLNKYNGDVKFARVHKRIREENDKRKTEGKPVLFSQYDDDILSMLKTIKTDVDGKVYDRNDILKKDAYFEQTVLMLINDCVVAHFPNLKPQYEDYKFIERRISQQYLSQYHDTYAYA